MSDRGEGGGAAEGVRRSRIFDYMEPAEAAPPPSPPPPPERAAEQLPADLATVDRGATRRRREAAALLGEFRRTAVLVPLSADGDPLTGEFGGIRWIYVFSDEPSLALFAIARGEGAREWPYDQVLGARLLDVAIPAMPVPYGVALDVGSEGQGALFPPVMGVVPDVAAVDSDMDDMDVDVESAR
ncbi:hypothetical protein [Streptomyces europaeiscabiei]|uniref:hypothetical protein n=1 Tax=Streptomyces europaeiscabiei TaxID=146819 RepID=UPI0029BD8224|nr:hypothetical protein [Streptomyces europaeiscabiei]MDX3583319.1 hypothetical protein [Streptomyces europaeiscabiei]MDX3620013.1 hypothetical protein [Streptomyces europaeiscabiei]